MSNYTIHLQQTEEGTWRAYCAEISGAGAGRIVKDALAEIANVITVKRILDAAGKDESFLQNSEAETA